MKARLLVIGAGAAAIAALAALTGPASVLAAPRTPGVARIGILPPRNPGHNVRPRPFFLGMSACRRGKDSGSCDRAVLSAIAHARSVLEGMRGMYFTVAAYRKLTHAEQLFVTVNLERVARHLPPAVELTRSLDKIAQAGAAKDDDPPLGRLPRHLPGGGYPVAAGGNWAGGFLNPLGADYGWMYDDAGSRWGHRDNILGTFVTRSSCRASHRALVMGAGYIGSGMAYGDSETELLVGVCGPSPTDTVLTWTRAKALLRITF
ncbi:MAG TPA: hypothetical protein VNF47_15020 [Streptosporangiaceae bacterium]|nr:hypothetical protein [Streptosporangiaceae bacterium]